MIYKGRNARGEKVGDGDIAMPYFRSNNKQTNAQINDRIFLPQFNL